MRIESAEEPQFHAETQSPDKTVALWFMDEARVGQKGRTGHRQWVRGQRPPGLCDGRFASAYIFAALRPSTGEDFALVLPRVRTEAMDRFLVNFAATVPAGTHAVMVLDGAGWHDQRSVTIPPNITLRLTAPTSTRWSASGCTCASATSLTSSSTTTRPSSTHAAKPGTPSRPRSEASKPSAPIPISP